MTSRLIHSPSSDSTYIPNETSDVPVIVTTSLGGKMLWVDMGHYPDNHAAILTVEQSKDLRAALKRAEKIALDTRPNED